MQSENTGRKIYQFLKEITISTGLPTGLIKPNTPSDPDYVAPIIDYNDCPIVTWQPIDQSCIVNPTCPIGWTLTADGNSCQQVNTEDPTYNGTTAPVIKINNNQWNEGGARIFAPGYASDGTGVVANYLTVPHLWVNGNVPWSLATRNTTDGRMNASAIWSSSSIPNGEYIGISQKFVLSSAKTFYIGIAGDDTIKVNINGVTFINKPTSGYNFNYWDIYPINLLAGTNYIEIFGENASGIAGFGVEIYDMTIAELLAATTASDLDIAFSSLSLVGQNFVLGSTIGYQCPAGWSLDTTAIGDYVCTLVNNTSPTLHQTGFKQYANRQRVFNGNPDGYQEPNTNGTGLGPYFPPAQDLITCPIT